MQTGDTDFIYRNELDMNCSQHDMTNRNGKSIMANQNGKSIMVNQKIQQKELSQTKF